MTKFVPNKQHLRESLLFCFNLKKNAAQSQCLLEEAYGEGILSKTTCNEWFSRFKAGVFNVYGKERSRQPKKFEDEQLEDLLEQGSTQTQQQLAETLNVDRSTVAKRLKELGMVQKLGNWLPHELTERAIANRMTICGILLQRHKRKGFMYRTITGDEKWLHYSNTKRQKARVKPGEPGPFTPQRNIHGSKILLCIWWGQNAVVYYELLNPNQTINASNRELSPSIRLKT